MRSAALVLTALVALSAGVASPLIAQTKAPAPAPKSGTSPAAPKSAPAKSGEKSAGPKSNSPIVIDADRMEAFKKEGLVVFTGNVVAKQDTSVQTADRMEVYLDDKVERVLRIISTGNVKIVTEDCRTGTARRAEYYDDDQRLLLIGDAKVWQEDNVITGDEIEILLAEDKSTVKGGTRGRVKSVFYPKRDEEKQDGPAPATAKKETARPAPCS
jgi:lipopolysaccharide export system protein LptA